MVWPAIVFFSSPTTLRRCSIAVIAIDMIFRFTVSMWSPEFATDQFRGLATFARADPLAIGALVAQRERNGGWGAYYALPVSLIAAAVAIVGLHILERSRIAPLLVYNLKWPLITLGVGAGSRPGSISHPIRADRPVSCRELVPF
jgi:hypothetical protein